jgi:hypothetical protein
METKKYTIAGKTFVFNLSLRADELIAPIKKDMFRDMHDVLSMSAEKLLNIQVSNSSDNDKTKDVINVVIDQARVNNWFYETGNAHKLCAILLIEEGKRLSEIDLREQEEFMADNATQEIASEVITHFFTRCGSFGTLTPRSFTKN